MTKPDKNLVPVIRNGKLAGYYSESWNVTKAKGQHIVRIFIPI